MTFTSKIVQASVAASLTSAGRGVLQRVATNNNIEIL